MAGHEDKARHYIALLDVARTNGTWNELPELIRKVTKHASARKLLVLTATAENELISRMIKPPLSATVTPHEWLLSLQAAFKDSGDKESEDNVQATACLAWAKWTGALREVDGFPMNEDLAPLFTKHGAANTTDWTKICLLKIAYMQGTTLAQSGKPLDAESMYDVAISWIDLHRDFLSNTPQASYWAEQLLAERVVTLKTGKGLSDKRFHAFQTWSTIASRARDVSPSVYGNVKSAHIVRVVVWKSYYSALSERLRLQRNNNETLSVAKQAAQLRKVESSYETELLRTHKFPKATETGDSIEQWVEQVIQNWQIFCGEEWRDSDLGEGGRNAATRNVLDILYRAASKTFQSTLILRRLFQVHKTLTEFDLAYRCLDTYIELIERGRERSSKSKQPDPSQDPNEIVMLTIAEGIAGLCSFGQQTEARKAQELGIKLERWLIQLNPEYIPDSAIDKHTHAVPQLDVSSYNPLSISALETVYRSIGISKAHWARWTPFSEHRTELQMEALSYLNRSCASTQPQLDSLYALALLLAETREINEAIQYVKTALERNADRNMTKSKNSHQTFLPFWHLLSLLLTSRQEFEIASRSSVAVTDQMYSPDKKSRRAENSEKQTGISGVVNMADPTDDLECEGLQMIIELEISQLALMELLDGPEFALNHSTSLLASYAKLFARFGVTIDTDSSSKDMDPPKSSAGTVRSFRGSIFSRRKPTPSVVQSTTAPSDVAPSLRNSARPVTQGSQAPTIQVTDETGKSPHKAHHKLRHSLDFSTKSSTKGSTKKLTRDHSKSRGTDVVPISKSEVPENEVLHIHTISPNTKSTIEGSQSDLNNQRSSMAEKHDADIQSKQKLHTIPHNLASSEQIPAPIGHKDQPPNQDVRLPTLHTKTLATCPVPRWSKNAGQKHALVVLNKLWLVIATLYRRGHMFDDAREACDEASRAAAKIESYITTVDPSASALATTGWGGGGKSSDEVWADVYCERAELVLAITRKREEEGLPTSNESVREALDLYEQCLMYFPNHVGGIIGLSNILLDYYEKKIELGRKVDDGKVHRPLHPVRPSLSRANSLPAEVMNGTIGTPGAELQHLQWNALSTEEDLRKTPENLNRIAARDRAYGLLSTLTKLGTGWDNAEAWYTLSRAHELGGEYEKAKGILWWCIELENTRPIRHWRNISCSGYVLRSS